MFVTDHTSEVISLMYIFGWITVRPPLVSHSLGILDRVLSDGQRTIYAKFCDIKVYDSDVT